MEFSELIQRAKEGDAEALADLHGRYHSNVVARLRDRLSPLLRRRDDTVDLCQSVFADVLRDLPRFEDRGEEAFRHWLYMKAENKVRSRLRKHLKPAGGRREGTLRTALGDGIAAEGEGPATRADRSDAGSRLEEALETLDPDRREILKLRTESDLSFAEIADLLGLPSADAARKRYARALISLRKQWQGD